MRFKKLINRAVALSVFFVFCVCLTAAADDSSSKKFPMHKMRFGNGVEPKQIATWTITDEEKSHLSVMVWDDKTERNYLTQFDLSNRGGVTNVGKPVPLGQGDVAKFDSVHVVERNGENTASADDGTVIVYAFMTSEKKDRATLLAIALDSKGEERKKPERLLDIKAHKDNIVARVTVESANGPESVGVACSVQFQRNTSSFFGYTYSRAFFLETDQNGKRLGDVSEVGIPKGGNMNFFRTGSPCYSDAGWMVPASNTRLAYSKSKKQGKKTTSPVGNELYIYSVTRSSAPAPKIKLKKIYKDNQRSWSTFGQAFFMPKGLSTGKKDSRKIQAGSQGRAENLFYSHRTYLPEDKWRLDRYSMSYGVVPINSKGKKAGDDTEIRLPGWNHKISDNPESYNQAYAEYVSPPMTTSDGKYFISQTRYVSMAREVDGKVIYNREQELSFYSFDPASGDVSIRYRRNSDYKGSFQKPMIRQIDGGFGVINSMSGDKNAFYFSKVRP